MKQYGQWNVTTSLAEEPNYNNYIVKFDDWHNGATVARVYVRIYLNMGMSAGQTKVERVNPDKLFKVEDADLLQIAEIEVNSIPELPMYVELAGVMANPIHPDQF